MDLFNTSQKGNKEMELLLEAINEKLSAIENKMVSTTDFQKLIQRVEQLTGQVSLLLREVKEQRLVTSSLVQSQVTGVQTPKVVVSPDENETSVSEVNETPDRYYEYHVQPTSGGRFNNHTRIHSASSEGDQDVLFILEIKGESAGFYPVAEKSLRLIVNRAYLLDPVCEVISGETGSRIEVVEKGSLEKDGEEWIVKTKCKITIG